MALKREWWDSPNCSGRDVNGAYLIVVHTAQGPVGKGARNRPMRSPISVSAPRITNKASPSANGASTAPPPSATKIAAEIGRAHV